MTQVQKWQRLCYMPATPLYPGRERVTASESHRRLSRQAAAEGMVLLKNDGDFLPFRKGAKLAVFGKAQHDYVKGGGGSGDTTVDYVLSLADGFAEKEQQGKVRVFAPLSRFYGEYVKEQYGLGKQPGCLTEPALDDELVAQARAFTDIAVITLCRYSGEGWDRTGTPHDGDFFLSAEEEAMVEKVRAAFPHMVVVLNTGGMMDTLWFRDCQAIHAALLAWQGGMEGGAAAADLLCGDECPSGHLTDTFADDFSAYPSSAHFNDSEDYVAYEDDIYVGYRYFETIPGAAQRVCYPFGFGLSYTTFAMEAVSAGREGDGFAVEVRVTNTGTRYGKEVAQLYVGAPQGKLGKPARVLAAFAKTALLAPGESETLTLRFDEAAIASYDDVGKVQKSAYLLEAGTYRFYLGNNVRDAGALDYVWTLDETRVVRQLSPRCVPNALSKRLLPDGSYETLETREVPAREDQAFPFDGSAPREWREPVEYSAWLKPEVPQLMDVYNGDRTLDELVASLNDAEIAHLLGGQPNRGVANTFGMGNLPRHGIPNVMTADGPAGLRILPNAGVTTTAFPCATLIACTWDEKIAYAIGHAGAEEVLENGIGIWLTPAINIHRSPLCGRNFEYYSEDPFLTGKMCAAMVRGIQSMKVAASVKHFCCNNREVNRRECDSRVSERALREIYLKAFEICVAEAQPWTIMSSYNPMNGVRNSENTDLLTGILRGEWGFDGIVTTDWYTHGEHWRELAAGNDIKMGKGCEEQLLEKLNSGELSRETMVESVKRLLRVILRLA